MSRLFITERERSMISDLTKEFMVDVVGQRLIYYPISELKNNTHPLYNENMLKVYDNPIEIPALVNSPENTNDTGIFGPEQLNALEAYIHHKDMIDKGINLVTGDFMKYGDIFYEITSVNRLRTIYGQVENIDGYKLTMKQSRFGQFNAPQVGPTDISHSDADAVQKEFTQTRGYSSINGQPTGDKRELFERGVIEHRETDTSGVGKIIEDEKTGADFYGDR